MTISADDVRGQKSPEWMKYFTNGKPNPEWMAMRESIVDILTSKGRTVAQGALAWNWARSPQTIPIPGFRTVKQVEENTGAMDFGPLTPEQMKEIKTILKRE
jgi:aryl-alcohol dehydrogenase-like predicted oxidoreductase